MAQGGIKKGFFFYFGLFVLLLVAIFCICLVVMMFNPGSTVLWMQYFTDNSTFQVIRTTDESKQEIDWPSVTCIDISCGYANVVVERNSDGELQQYAAKDSTSRDGLYIVNKAKGFTVAASAQQFSYDVRFDSGVLKIEIKEPTGFIYFSKEIKIVLHATTSKTATYDANWNFENVELNVTTAEGDVSIGGPKNNAEEIKLSNLSVKTKSGDIALTQMFDPTSLKPNDGNGISLKTESGTITAAREVEYEGKKSSGLQLNCNGEFKIDGKGKIAFRVLKADAKKITLTCGSGSWDFDYVSAEKINCVDCVDGNYLFGEVVGVLSVNSQDSVKSPNIVIKKMDGDFFLETSLERNGRPNIQIDKITGNLSVLADKGNVKVKEACKGVIIDSRDDLKVDITMAKDADKHIEISTENGEVRLAFLGNVPAEQSIENGTLAGVSITTKKKVTIDITKEAKFVANMFVNDGKVGEERTRTDKNKIFVNNRNEMLDSGMIEDEPESPLNPLRINQNLPQGTNGKMEIVTNDNVYFNLKTEQELVA